MKKPPDPSPLLYAPLFLPCCPAVPDYGLCLAGDLSIYPVCCPFIVMVPRSGLISLTLSWDAPQRFTVDFLCQDRLDRISDCRHTTAICSSLIWHNTVRPSCSWVRVVREFLSYQVWLPSLGTVFWFLLWPLVLGSCYDHGVWPLFDIVWTCRVLVLSAVPISCSILLLSVTVLGLCGDLISCPCCAKLWLFFHLFLCDFCVKLWFVLSPSDYGVFWPLFLSCSTIPLPVLVWPIMFSSHCVRYMHPFYYPCCAELLLFFQLCLLEFCEKVWFVLSFSDYGFSWTMSLFYVHPFSLWTFLCSCAQFGLRLCPSLSFSLLALISPRRFIVYDLLIQVVSPCSFSFLWLWFEFCFMVQSICFVNFCFIVIIILMFHKVNFVTFCFPWTADSAAAHVVHLFFWIFPSPIPVCCWITDLQLCVLWIIVSGWLPSWPLFWLWPLAVWVHLPILCYPMQLLCWPPCQSLFGAALWLTVFELGWLGAFVLLLAALAVAWIIVFFSLFVLFACQLREGWRQHCQILWRNWWLMFFVIVANDVLLFFFLSCFQHIDALAAS